MSRIKNKSAAKQHAAQCLINNGFYTESVHCSYYSTLLYMKYILHHLPNGKGRVPYNEQKIKGASSHQYILRLIKGQVSSPSKQKIINNCFRDLKDRRNDADYSDILFSAKECYIIKEKAEFLKRILKEIFENL